MSRAESMLCPSYNASCIFCSVVPPEKLSSGDGPSERKAGGRDEGGLLFTRSSLSACLHKVETGQEKDFENGPSARLVVFWSDEEVSRGKQRFRFFASFFYASIQNLSAKLS